MNPSSSALDADELMTRVRDSLIEVLPNETVCPNGYICNVAKPEMANCTKIRQLSILVGVGDIHAGLYCPEGLYGYLNCPVGSYCEQPDRIELCPGGKFCPHKTAVPAIRCERCDEGSTMLKRQLYGYIIFGLLLAMFIVYVILHLVRQYRADLYKRLLELSALQLDSVRVVKIRKERQETLERIRPKLFRINARLQALSDEAHESEGRSSSSINRVFRSPIFASDGKTIRFNAGRLFDQLDKDGNGYLSYEELQTVLELNLMQLDEFVKRMNDLASSCAPNEHHDLVSRSCFRKYFIGVLQETQNFGPTEEEVESLWDEIANGTEKVRFDAFYRSILSNFLSDPQINALIRLFRTVQEEIQGNASPDSFISISGEKDFMSGRFGAGSLREYTVREDYRRSKTITRRVFLDHYARLLAEVTTNPDELLSIRPTEASSSPGVDITFMDLSLAVTVGESSVNVVNHVSGRLKASTMTALMGGSGAGKTSLLNALCGRAFYGETKGRIFVNGNETSIENHQGSMGFVPQDDIVHGALTVRENLVFSGLFSLPQGTSRSEIEDLADATLANLGLSRVADSLVGDVNRRGVSGGEKKRVNIGVELMKKPAILFLDEPTSGLDSSSALLVMKSLKTLVESQGVTILSVIHQPRKFIFDLFDSLVLLGVGGNMVYHGPVNEAERYFGELPAPYHLPMGESVADWLIDVSSGRLEPEQPERSDSTDDINGELALESLVGDTDAVGMAGPSSNKVDTAYEEARLRREDLYNSWKSHLESLGSESKSAFSPPEPYGLPVPEEKPSFLYQLKFQLKRNFLLALRNRFTKFVDTAIIVGAVSLISLFEGVVEVTIGGDPTVDFNALTSGNFTEMVMSFPELFEFSLGQLPFLIRFAMKLGIIVSVLLGLMASKAITQYRLEFFREAGSGYSINAYFFAVNITSFLEHSVQMIFAAVAAFWFRDSIGIWYSYYINFLALMWICVAWGLFIPLITPPENVVLVVGFFMAFFGLLFSGALPPVEFSTLYEGNPFLALLSGFVSVTRYFVEGLTVHEQRCLPVQSGFTVDKYAFNFPLDVSASALAHLGQNDRSVIQQTCNGWYWGVLPAFAVGLTVRYLAAGVIHVSYRSKQAKKPLFSTIFQQPLTKNRGFWEFVVYVLGTILLILFTSWTILGHRGESGIWDPLKDPNANETLTNEVVDYYEAAFS